MPFGPVECAMEVPFSRCTAHCSKCVHIQVSGALWSGDQYLGVIVIQGCAKGARQMEWHRFFFLHNGQGGSVTRVLYICIYERLSGGGGGCFR